MTLHIDATISSAVSNKGRKVQQGGVSHGEGALTIRHDWSSDETVAIYDSPFMDLVFRAQTIHRTVFDPNKVQFSRLLNIKTGGCPEDCGYCSQSAHHDVALQASKLMDPARVVEEAKA